MWNVCFFKWIEDQKDEKIVIKSIQSLVMDSGDYYLTLEHFREKIQTFLTFSPIIMYDQFLSVICAHRTQQQCDAASTEGWNHQWCLSPVCEATLTSDPQTSPTSAVPLWPVKFSSDPDKRFSEPVCFLWQKNFTLRGWSMNPWWRCFLGVPSPSPSSCSLNVFFGYWVFICGGYQIRLKYWWWDLCFK